MYESLSTRLHQCSGVSAEVGEGACQVIDALKSIGGTLLLTGDGPPHEYPYGDITDTGSIIIRPGLAHPLLKHDSLQRKKRDMPSGSFGYIHDTGRFDLAQSFNIRNPTQTDAEAEGQLALATVLYPRFLPTYGWIDEAGENEPSTKRIQSAELKYLFWANFFGPRFVERYGRDFLLGAPGWKKEVLDDGGILYVVDESYMRWRTTPDTEAIDYFRTKVPSIRQYRSRGFERTEAKLSGDPLPKRPRKKHK